MKIKLMLAVNDYRNGIHTGEVDMIGVDIDLLTIEGPPVSCSSDGRRLELDGLRFDLEGYRTWVDNWCWDCAVLESVHVARILNHLRRSGWSCFEAEEALLREWEAGEDIAAEELEALLRAPSSAGRRERCLLGRADAP